MVAISNARRTHILYSDATGGGHMHGYGDPTKSHFPSDWDAAKIIAEVLALANDPNAGRAVQANTRIRIEGVRDHILIRVVLSPDGTEVWTAHPI
jgi:hypothetical protein